MSKDSQSVLVCGGRDYQDAQQVFALLDRIDAACRVREIIQGGAAGADRWAREWANARNKPLTTFHADWDNYGRSAGPKRNQRMIDEGKPDLVVAFPGGRGTADMLRRADAAEIARLTPNQGNPAHDPE